MATQDRRPPPPLAEDLFARPSAYSFFQAVRLLRYYQGLSTGSMLDSFLRNNLRVHPDLSLAFPGSDIVGLKKEIPAPDPDTVDDAATVVEIDPQKIRFDITTSFLGLYGASSPLPTFYTEDLLDDASEDLYVVRDFLDIVNYTLYPLIILAWSKYRLYIKVLDEKDPEYYERLFCLLGVGFEEVRRTARRSYELLRYIGLFTQWPHSAKGLQTMLADFLETKVEIEQCVLRRVKIPLDQRFGLGLENHELGECAYLGEEIDDRMGKIHIAIGPMDEAQYHAYLPGSENFRALCGLIRFYTLEPVDFDLELLLEPVQAEPACLGQCHVQSKWSALGYDTWVLGEHPPARTSATFSLRNFDF